MTNDRPNLFPLMPEVCFPFASQNVQGEDLSLNWDTQYFLVRRYGLVRDKTLSKRPLTEDGWSETWDFLVTTYPKLADEVLRVYKKNLERKEEAGSRRQFESELLVRLNGVTLLGGHGYEVGLKTGQEYAFLATDSRILITLPPSNAPLLGVAMTEVATIDFSGPGTVVKGGRFFGGGFGLTAAAEGMIAASVLNALTRRATIQTVMRLEARSCELFFFCSTQTPEQLRITMSPVLGAIRSSNNNEPEERASSVVSDLERLANLRLSGVLSEEEFSTLKHKLFSDI